ncbi:MAG: EAL domain-containing protein [Janthinobacterium lividum]
MSFREVICVLRVGHRRTRALLCGLLLGVLLLSTWVQVARAQFTRFQNITDEQGLGNSAIDALAQDRDGYILFGTEGGLYRYDGVGTALYDDGLPSAAWIQQIVIDKTGRAWVVTTTGLYLRDGATFEKIGIETPILPLKSPHLLVVGEEDVVLNVGGTLLRAPLGGGSAGIPGVGAFAPLLNEATLTGVPGLKKARFVVPDTGGALLVGCGTALCRVEGGRASVLGEADGLPADAWQVALRASDGTLWARSLDRIAWRRPGQAAFSVARFPARGSTLGAAASGEHASYAANPEMLNLLDDGHGGVLTQNASGIVDWDGTRWRPYLHHPGGLPASRIQAMMFDREGSLWIGSFGTGAFRSIGLNDWEHWTGSDGLPSDIVWAMTRLPDGQFWVATDSGTVAIEGTTAGVSAETNYILKATRAGRLWLAPAGMPLLRRDPAGRSVVQFPSIGKVVSAELDRDNRLWLGTAGGLFAVADADAPEAELRVERVLDLDATLVTTDATGQVWVASPTGVFRRDGGGRFEPVVEPALLKSAPVALAFSPDGELWVGTGSDGVQRFHVVDGHAEPLPSFVAPAIGSNNVMFLHLDRRGWMWVGTDHGIDVFDGQGWRRLDGSSGPITNDMNQTAVYEDTDGSMWFGTSHGLSHLIDPARRQPEPPLHPLVTGVSVGERTLRLSTTMRAHWSREPFVIRFVDLDYTHGHGVAFRYRMDGLDTAWSTTAGHEVRYSDLPAGELRFELVAVDTVHGAVSAETGFTITVRAPWWQRWWFYGLCGFAAAGVLVGTWRVRMRLLLRDQRRLEQVVSTRTAEIEQARRELERLAMSDALTGLANRRAIMGALGVMIATALESAAPLAVLLCDIDHFKRINDGFGHIAGDEVLAAFGHRLGGVVRSPEAVGRYGGEEFLLLLPGDPDTLAGRVSAIRSAITDPPYVFGEAERTVTSSGGLAFLRAGDTAVSLLERADVALYKAKKNGRNRIEEERSETVERGQEPPVVADATAPAPSLEGTSWAADVASAPVPGTDDPPCCDLSHEHRQDHSFRGRCDLESDLRTALADEQFLLHYQPIVDLDRGVVTSYEALLRWQSPSRGNVAPVDFIPFAEEAGLMIGIGDWVLQAACREAAGWEEGAKICVNLSPVQFRLPDLVDRVARALAEAGLPPERLELEVTETAMIEDVATAAVMLRALRAMGVSIALDDFGTGYSSLSFLHGLPFDRIKIDRSFVQDLGIRPGAIAIVRAVVELCRDLEVATTAEGVETDEQVEMLRAAGCTELQGYRFGLPRPSSEMPGCVPAPVDETPWRSLRGECRG